MANHDPSKIRSFALVGHGGCGKTSIGEAIALITGRNTRLGSVTDHTSILDFDEEEHKRGGSVATSVLSCVNEGYELHVVDTPGDGNFIHEARGALQAVDAAIIILSATDGVEVSTEKVSRYAANQGMPRAVFINKMDRDYANIDTCLNDITEVLGLNPVLMQLPIGQGDEFKGVVDLINHKALTYDGSGRAIEGDIPAEMADEVAAATEAMMEAVAMADDELVERYLDAGELTQDEVKAGITAGLRAGTAVPVLIGSATRNIGVDRLLWLAQALPDATTRTIDASQPESEELVEITGDPEAPFAALCVKTSIDPFAGQISFFRVMSGTATATTYLNTRSNKPERVGALLHIYGKHSEPIDKAVPGEIFGVAKLKDTHTGDTLCDPKHPVILPYVAPPPPMISFTIKPRSRHDVDKLKTALHRILAEDPALHESYDNVTKELVLAGMGALHVQLATQKMERKYGVCVDLGTPAIPYREAIQGSADVRYRHKKQTGGAGQFGEVSIRVRPNERNAGYEFVNMIKGGVIPNSLIPSVDKGIRDQMSKGILAGFEVVDIIIELYDGKYHPVDSKDIAFQIAGRQAIKQAVLQCRPILLEPIQRVDIVCPNELVGEIMGDLNGQRRGRVLNMENRGRNAVVKALVPLSEMLSYAPDLRSMTGGKGSYTMEFDGYEQVPSHMQDNLVEQIKRLHDEDD